MLLVVIWSIDIVVLPLPPTVEILSPADHPSWRKDSLTLDVAASESRVLGAI